LNQGQYRILGMFEQECIRRGIKLEVMEIDIYNAVETRQAALRPEISAPGLGYVMDLLWTRSDEFQRSHIDFLARLAGMQRPVALLDETGDFALPLPFSENPLFQVFRIEGKRAGGRVARLLLGMGHRSVAYISTSHNSLYSRHRLEGVIEQYSKAGCTDGVRPIINEHMDHVLLYILTVTGFDDTLIRRILSIERTQRQAEDLFNEFARFRERGPAQLLTREAAQIIRKNLAGIGDLAQRDIDPPFFNKMVRAALAEAALLAGGFALSPLFDKALADRDITAWICVTDGVALLALAYLGRHGISVPDTLSVVGFDNAPGEAFDGRLTSFDFNATGFVHGILNYLIRPPLRRGHYHHTPVEVEGTIVQRNTTAPPPQSPFAAS
jgi:hypothetical protein